MPVVSAHRPLSFPDAAAARAAAAAASTAPDFAADIDPAPKPADSYGVSFGSWTGVVRTVTAGPRASDHVTSGPPLAEAGKPFVVDYTRTPYGLDEGRIEKIKVHYRIDGGAIQSADVADGTRDMRHGGLMRDRVSVDVPADARGEIEYWFELTDKDGITHWDSDYGNNFHADVVPTGGAHVKFDEMWGEAVSGPIKAGEALRLDYDADRLRQFLYGLWHHGYPSYDLNAYVSFDGGPPTELPISVIERGDHGEGVGVTMLEPAIEVPHDAEKVSIWFRGTAYGGARTPGGWANAAYDSDYGKNYTFDVEP